jgi:DNA-binding HxlR family transcriptional regulator
MGGRPKGYGQYCPISRAIEVLGERWSLMILRDMLVGTTRFNDLARGLPGLSRSLLSKRLRQFERAGLVEQLDGQYLLTDAGRDLEPIVFGLGEWGAKWAFTDPDPDELDPLLLVWWVHSRLDTSVLPERRVVIAVRFSDYPRVFWLVIEGGTPSVCLTDPGFEVDVTIRSDLESLYRVWPATRAGRVTFDGSAAMRRRMPSLLRLSPVASIVAEAAH